MKREDKPKIHIGVIGHVDHSKFSLSEAIKQTLEKKAAKEVCSERSHAIMIKTYMPGEKPKKKKLKRKKRR